MATKKYDASTLATVKGLVPIDDVMFQKICEDIETCEEIISTILGRKVKIVDQVPQDSIGNLQGRSVRLDCLCLMEDGVYVNVEVQKQNNDDHEARARYNAAVITAKKTPKSAKFKDVAQVIVIFITQFDIFGDGLPIYHIDRVVRETGKTRTDGFTEIYVNTVAKNSDDELNTNVTKLMELFLDRQTYDTERFPVFSKRKRTFVETEKGEMEMCEKVDQLAREREQEAILVTLFEGVQAGGVKITYAAKKANLSLNEFKDQMRQRGFEAPRHTRRAPVTNK